MPSEASEAGGGGDDEARKAVRVRITGVVQGVGFRPFVYRIAHELGIAGSVQNGAEGVEIVAEGSASELDRLIARLRAEAPPAASIARVDVTDVPVSGARAFAIVESATHERPTVRMAPDLAVCAACLKELRDPGDPRHGYPYITCTNCGPRASIIEGLPYDRARTTMGEWPMCPTCAAQYRDPLDRRYHAQPVACPTCGPHYRLVIDGAIAATRDAALVRGAELLREGRILAIKGIGGFHLAVDASNESAVAALRERKFRKEKPFAVMFASLEQARRFVECDALGERELTSMARPIVLLPRRTFGDRRSPPVEAVAPESGELGVFLPYAPLQTLLFDRGAPSPLVLTSANHSSEPIAFEDDDAFDRLAGIADGFLVGERRIARRVDDSVVRVRSGQRSVLRRARGLAPGVVATLPRDRLERRPILALGSDLKSAIALTIGDEVLLSPFIGDLGDRETDRAFREAIEDLLEMYRVPREELLVVHDLHPELVSTRAAAELTCSRRVAIQHHEAHIASVLLEHGVLDGSAVGIALDGTGWGHDGTVWGFEFLVGSLRQGFTRAGSLAPVPMPGGDAAARHPLLALAGHLADAPDASSLLATLERAPFDCPSQLRQGLAIARSGLRSFGSSSAGRLFDAAAAILGWHRAISYEGQAAIWLEERARHATRGTSLALPAERDPHRGWQVRGAALLRELIRHREGGAAIEELALGFHHALAACVTEVAVELAAAHRTGRVALSGGVLQNATLCEDLARRLLEHGLTPLTQRDVPCNDGGIALGQVALAALRIG